MLAGMIEHARTTAMTSRCHVALVLAEPGDLPTDDGLCRLGLFKVESWPESSSETIKSVQISRWRNLESGAILTGGGIGDGQNPMDHLKLKFSFDTGSPTDVTAHAIGFNPRGGLRYPPGSTPVVMRIAEGRYQNGKATPKPHGVSGIISENHLKIGRITARPYRTDG